MKPHNLVVHPEFEATLSLLRHATPQGILLHGEPGVGLRTLAEVIAGKTFALVQPRTSKGEVDRINGTISVEQIRLLYEQTRSSGVPYVIIDAAERLSLAAQNAFLKLLEEPPAHTHFILTSHRPELLLPTIRSRVNAYHVPPITKEQSTELLRRGSIDESLYPQVLFLAAGRPAKLISLRDNPRVLEAHSRVMSDARSFLSDSSRYIRLATALKYTSSRAESLKLVDAALQIVKHTLEQSASIETAETAERLLAIHAALDRNASPRLQLARFVVQ